MLPSSTSLLRTRCALMFYFFLLGAVIGNWNAILPFVKDEQRLDNGMLGVILLSAVGGAMVALPIITYINDKYGTGLSTVLGSAMMLIGYPVIGVTYHRSLLVLGIFLLGFGAGCVDVSINGQAVLYEKAIKTPSLGMFQATSSIGGLSGALLGGFIMQLYDVPTIVETSICSAILIVPALLLGYWLLSEQDEKLINHNEQLDCEQRRSEKSDSYRGGSSVKDFGSTGSEHALNPLIGAEVKVSHHLGPVVAKRPSDSDTDHLLYEPLDCSIDNSWQECSEEELMRDERGDLVVSFCTKYETVIKASLLCFLAFFGEGSVGDWSCIYLSDNLHSSPFISTLGYVGFSLCVAFGRYFSDYFTVIIGRRQLLTYSGLLAAVGLGVVVAGPSMTSSLQQSAVVAIIGFSLCGVGLSAISPAVTSLAGSHEVSEAACLKPAETIGIVTSVGYLGIMLSPPLMGGLSIWLYSLRWSFAVDAGCLLFISLIALLIRKDALVVK